MGSEDDVANMPPHELAFMMVEYVRDNGVNGPPDLLPEIEDLRWAVATLTLYYDIPQSWKPFVLIWKALKSDKGVSFIHLQGLLEPLFLEVQRLQDKALAKAARVEELKDFDLF
jgi:hypothetical protein